MTAATKKRNLKKTSEKGLTKGKKSGIINRLSHESETEETASWKLNNIKEKVTTLEIPLKKGKSRKDLKNTK